MEDLWEDSPPGIYYLFGLLRFFSILIDQIGFRDDSYRPLARLIKAP